MSFPSGEVAVRSGLGASEAGAPDALALVVVLVLALAEADALADGAAGGLASEPVAAEELLDFGHPMARMPSTTVKLAPEDESLRMFLLTSSSVSW